MPDSWIENGVRRAVVYGGDLVEDKLTLQKFSGHWLVVEDKVPF